MPVLQSILLVGSWGWRGPSSLAEHPANGMLGLGGPSILGKHPPGGMLFLGGGPSSLAEHPPGGMLQPWSRAGVVFMRK